MQTSEMSYAEYLTPGVSISSRYHISHQRSEAYSDITPKPLHLRRKRFISMVSTFLFVQLLASISLVISVSMTLNSDKRSSSAGEKQACKNCDEWCASNRSLSSMGHRVTCTRTMVMNPVDANTSSALCCVRRNDLLSIIYEKSMQSKVQTRDTLEKLFDGIRVTDRWTEDDINKWPKDSSSSISYFKENRTFIISAHGTYFVHSRIDFSRSNTNKYYNQTIHIRNESHPSSFEDNRIDQNPRSTIYTSSIDVMVELTKGEQLVMLTDPQNWSSPRSIVVYRLQEA